MIFIDVEKLKFEKMDRMAAMVNMLLSWSYFIRHDMQYFSTGQKLFEYIYISKNLLQKKTLAKITELILSKKYHDTQ